MENSYYSKFLTFFKTLTLADIPRALYAFYQKYGIAPTLVIIYALSLWAYGILKMKGWWFKKQIRGEHVFITGAGSGIGREMATLLAKKGAKISVSDINFEGAQETAKIIQAQGGSAHAIKLDVTNIDDVEKAHIEAKKKFGVVDILINNAGVTFGKSITNMTKQGIDLVLNVNTVSQFYTVKQFLPDMLKQDKGHIVTIASAGGTVGVANNADYAASKWACYGFDESIRAELRKMGSKVKTTNISPYYINTGMFKGVKAKHPTILPFLDQTWICKRIVNAILQEEAVVITPMSVNLNFLLRFALPTSWFDRLQDFMGTSSGMDTYVGRQNKS